MEEEIKLHTHQDQSAFIKNHSSKNGEIIRNKNEHIEDSCLWSDSFKDLQHDDKINNQSQVYSTSQHENENVTHDNDFQEQDIQISIQTEAKSFRNSQDSQRERAINTKKQYQKSKSIHYRGRTKTFGLDQDNHSPVQDYSNDDSSAFKHSRYNYNGDENILGKSICQKMKQIQLQHEKNSQFRRNLVLLTKIKLKLQNFYKNFTTIYRTRILNHNIRKKINDQSDFLEQKEGFLVQTIQLILRYRIFMSMKGFPLINPQSNYGFYIKLLLAFFNIIYFFLFSIFIVFHANNEFEEIVCRAINLIWVIEILFNLNLQVFKGTDIVSTRSEILFIYFKSKSIFDIIPLLINFTSYYDPRVKILKQIIQFTKLHNLFLDLKDIQLQLCMRVKQYYFVQLINLICELFLLGHIISCLWYLVGLAEVHYMGEDNSWFAESVGHDMTQWKLYISALYWSLSLMTMGSNTCTTLLQTIFTTFVLLFTSIAFGYTITVIGIILQDMDQKDENRRKDMSIINEYMRQRNISKQIQQFIFQYQLIYFFCQQPVSKDQYQLKEQLENQQVLNKISVDLRDSLLIEQNKQILSQIDILCKKLSNQTLSELSLHLKEEYYLPNQIVNYERDSQDQSLMYIIEGEFELYHFSRSDLTKHSIDEKLKVGDIFGQINFFCGVSQDIFAKATKFTKIVKIERQDFLRVIKNNDKEYEQFCEVRDRILNYECYKDINIKCNMCNTTSHHIQNCSIVHLNRKAILQKIGRNQQEQQKRQTYNRKYILHENPLSSFLFKQILADKLISKFKEERELNVMKLLNLSLSDSSQSEERIGEEEDEDEEEEDSFYQQVKNEEEVSREQEGIKNQIASNNIKSDLIVSPLHKRRQSGVSQKYNSQSMNELEEQIKGLDMRNFKSELGSQEKINLIESCRVNSQQNISENSKIGIKEQEAHRKYRESNESTVKFQSYENAFNEEKNDLQQFMCNNSKKQQLISNGKNRKISGQRNFSKLSSIGENNFSEQQQISVKDLRNYKLFQNLIRKLFFQENNLKSISTISNKTIQYQLFRNQQEQAFNPWSFDIIKDYEYYFPSGNSNIFISKYSKINKRKNKKTIKYDILSKRY